MYCMSRMIYMLCQQLYVATNYVVNSLLQFIAYEIFYLIIFADAIHSSICIQYIFERSA